MQLNPLPGVFGTPIVCLGQAGSDQLIAKAAVVDPDFGQQAKVFIAANLAQFNVLAVAQLGNAELLGAPRQFAHMGALVAHFRSVDAIQAHRNTLAGYCGPGANGYAKGVSIINAADFVDAYIAKDRGFYCPEGGGVQQTGKKGEAQDKIRQGSDIAAGKGRRL